jgi:hypothetical protein
MIFNRAYLIFVFINLPIIKIHNKILNLNLFLRYSIYILFIIFTYFFYLLIYYLIGEIYIFFNIFFINFSHNFFFFK